MNFLLLTPQLPFPPRQGTTIRNFALIRHLSRQHTVDLLTFLAPGERLAQESPLHQLCRRVSGVAQPVRSAGQRALDTICSPLPDMALRLEADAMHRLVHEWLTSAHYDIVQVEGIEMAQYGLPMGKRQKRASIGATWPVTLFDNHNCEYLLQKRSAITDLRRPQRWPAAAYSLVQWQKLRWYERTVCRLADAVVAVSAADRAALTVLAPDIAPTVAPNGVEMADYPACGLMAAAPQPPYTLLFTGKMDYRPNIDAVLWFGQSVLPRIQAQEPNVRFQIVGLNPHRRLDVLRSNPAVEITGGVPDPRPYLQGATLCVIPMRVGGGTRLKALEAMACGKALVSTTLGVEGIGVRHDRELLLADTPAAFAAATVSLIHDAQTGGSTARRLGQSARQFVSTRYDWAQIMPIFAQVYEGALARRQRLAHTGVMREK